MFSDGPGMAFVAIITACIVDTAAVLPPNRHAGLLQCFLPCAKGAPFFMGTSSMPPLSVPGEAMDALPFETALADHEFGKVGPSLVPECFKMVWIISASAFFQGLQSHTEVVTWPDTISSVVDITSNSIECTVSDVGSSKDSGFVAAEVTRPRARYPVMRCLTITCVLRVSMVPPFGEGSKEVPF